MAFENNAATLHSNYCEAINIDNSAPMQIGNIYWKKGRITAIYNSCRLFASLVFPSIVSSQKKTKKETKLGIAGYFRLYDTNTK